MIPWLIYGYIKFSLSFSYSIRSHNPFPFERVAWNTFFISEFVLRLLNRICAIDRLPFLDAEISPNERAIWWPDDDLNKRGDQRFIRDLINRNEPFNASFRFTECCDDYRNRLVGPHRPSNVARNVPFHWYIQLCRPFLAALSSNDQLPRKDRQIWHALWP